MKCSICIACYDKAGYLHQTLKSIWCQRPPFEWEVIVVDDGTPNTSVLQVCRAFPHTRYLHINRDPGYRNPACARNVAYRAAKGEVVICQSDDVIHASPNCVENLVGDLTPGHFLIATVVNVDKDGKRYQDINGTGYGDRLAVYTSPRRMRPLFFLGSLYRRDLYAIGGNDEDFVAPSAEDRWFAMCLMNGLGLKPQYSNSIVGHHQHHAHCDPSVIRPSQDLLKAKVRAARSGDSPWCASGGPWQWP